MPDKEENLGQKLFTVEKLYFNKPLHKPNWQTRYNRYLLTENWSNKGNKKLKKTQLVTNGISFNRSDFVYSLA